MTLSTIPRIAIPADIKVGDVLVFVYQGKTWRREVREIDHDYRWSTGQDGCYEVDGVAGGPGTQCFASDGDAPYMESHVVRIVRRRPSKAKKARPDKDAEWLRQIAADREITIGSAWTMRRLRRIARRLDGAKVGK